MVEKKQTTIRFKAVGPVTVGTIVGADMLDGMAVQNFGKQGIEYASAHPGLNLLLDFSHVDYLASAALTELIRINDAVVAQGGTIRLYGIRPDILKVFEITQFDKMFVIYDDEQIDRSVERYSRSLKMAEEEDAWENRRA